MTDDPISLASEEPKPAIERPCLSNWAWRPWYAKLWWSLIAVYWTGAAGALLFGPLREFYGSDLASFLNIALYPVFALFVLSIGWLFAWKNALDYATGHPEIEAKLGWKWSTERHDFHDERMRRSNDPTDPTSRSYIANETLRMFRR